MKYRAARSAEYEIGHPRPTGSRATETSFSGEVLRGVGSYQYDHPVCVCTYVRTIKNVVLNMRLFLWKSKIVYKTYETFLSIDRRTLHSRNG